MRAAWRGALAFAALASTSGVTTSARADAGRVALVRPGVPDSTIAEALNRIQGELIAEGFEVVLVDPGFEGQSATSADAGAPPDTLATIDLSVDEGTHVAELRVVDTLTNKIVIRRAPVDAGEPSRAAGVLALRAVELLRASLLELLLESRRPPPPAAAPAPPTAIIRHATTWAAAGLPEERPLEWGVELGASVLADFGGVPPAVVGLARVKRKIGGGFAVRGSLMGLGSKPQVDGVGGNAVVSQDMGLLEAVVTPWPHATLYPLFTAGVGALFTAVDGQADWPYAGRHDERWAVAADVGAGLALKLDRHFDLSAEVHALVARPFPVVEFNNRDVAQTAQPSVIGSLAFVGWL